MKRLALVSIALGAAALARAEEGLQVEVDPRTGAYSMPAPGRRRAIQHPTVYQVCYQVKATVKNPSHPGVFVHGDLGGARLDVSRQERVCRPSVRTLLP